MQVRCFPNVAAHLAEGGVFVIEAFVPDVTRFVRQQQVSVDRVGVSRHDPVAQTVDSRQIVVRGDGIRLQPVRLRYAWPAALDLMAAGAASRSRRPPARTSRCTRPPRRVWPG